MDKDKGPSVVRFVREGEIEMAKNSDLIRQWFEEVWNQGREATIDDLCTKAAVGHGQTPDGSDIVGPDHFRQFWKAFRAAITAIHFEIHQTIEEGEMVIARWTIKMKHTGPFLGIAPTAKPITATGMSMMRFLDGKIVEAWDNWDQLALMAQLGVVSLENLSSPTRPEARIA
jgi:predicted ester cyclase